MDHRFIAHSDLPEFLRNLSSTYAIATPRKSGDSYHYAPLSDSLSAEATLPNMTDIDFGEIRTCEPLKAFFFQARKRVSVGFGTPDEPQKPWCILGAKACDLKSLEILDGVFIDDDYTDPFYAHARSENLIFSSDCTAPADTCFCRSLENDPFPHVGYDLNFSPVADGYVVETGSEKGRETIAANEKFFAVASERNLNERDQGRGNACDQVDANIREHEIPVLDDLAGTIKRNYESELWREEGSTCVECGACNTVCPTCHCFLLYDQGEGENNERYRLWDSCLIKDFARVAGDSNPRAELWMRLRNRFEKKFDFFPSVKNEYACTGCGRCINACPGKIDIRRVLKRNVESVPA